MSICILFGHPGGHGEYIQTVTRIVSYCYLSMIHSNPFTAQMTFVTLPYAVKISLHIYTVRPVNYMVS